MSVAEATPDLEQVDRNDRAFLGHPKGLGYLGFTEACERFSYYSMQTLLVLYMVNYLLVPGRMEKVIGLNWLQAHVYHGISGQPLASAIFGTYTALVYGTPIIGGIVACNSLSASPTTSFRQTFWRDSTSLRLKARTRLTMSRACCEARKIVSRFSWALEPGGTWRAVSLLSAMIGTSALLRSWAMPPASVPSASSFWECWRACRSRNAFAARSM